MGIRYFFFLSLLASLPVSIFAQSPNRDCPGFLGPGISSVGTLNREWSGVSHHPFLGMQGKLWNPEVCSGVILEEKTETRETLYKTGFFPEETLSVIEEKRRRLVSLMTRGRDFYVSLGYRYSPFPNSLFLMEADGFSFLQGKGIPHARKTGSLFLGFNLPFSGMTGIFLLEDVSGAGLFYRSSGDQFFFAWHPVAKTGTLGWSIPGSEWGLPCSTRGELLRSEGTTEGRVTLGQSNGDRSCPIHLEAIRQASQDDLQFFEGEGTGGRSGKSGQVFGSITPFPFLKLQGGGLDLGNHGYRFLEMETRWEMSSSPWSVVTGMEWNRQSTYGQGGTVNQTRLLTLGFLLDSNHFYTDLSLQYSPGWNRAGLDWSSGYRGQGGSLEISLVYNRIPERWILLNRGADGEGSHRFYPWAKKIIRVSLSIQWIYIKLEKVEGGPYQGNRLVFQSVIRF